MNKAAAPSLGSLGFTPVGTMSDTADAGTTDTGYKMSFDLGAKQKGGAVDYSKPTGTNTAISWELPKENPSKYFGARPRVEGLKLEDKVSPQYQDTGTISTESKKVSGDVGKMIGKEAINQGMQIIQAKRNYAQNALSDDLEYWKSQGAYWFDKEQNLAPDIDKIMSGMPTSTEALQEGTLTGGKAGSGAAGVLNPAGALAEVIATGGGKNKKFSGLAEYTGNRSGEMALQGLASGGWIGAVAGAALGTVLGVFEFSSAVDQDEKNDKKYRAELERMLKDWTIARNKRLVAQHNQQYAEKEAKLSNYEAKKDAKEAKVNLAKSNRRQLMKQAIQNAGSISNARRQSRINRWSSRRAA